jgi:hypothetical protein
LIDSFDLIDALWLIEYTQSDNYTIEVFSIMKSLSTWWDKSKFEYSGSILEGTHIYYGEKRDSIVSKEEYEALLKNFKGRTVKCGCSRTSPPPDSVGEWLNERKGRALASYVCAILIDEGYAKKGNVKYTISFK